MTTMLESISVSCNTGTHPLNGTDQNAMVLEMMANQPNRPGTIVLQPGGVLDQENSSAFQQALESSLDQVTDGVIVDLLWVESTDTYGVAALAAGLQRATMLGKALSFQSMDSQTRAALEVEWNRQREASFGSWNDLFEADLEQFLDGLGQVR